MSSPEMVDSRSRVEDPHVDEPGTVQQIALPPAARSLSTLPRIDYEDAFRVQTGPAEGRTGEQWARAVLASAPAGLRRQLRWGWFALGLKLGGPSSDASLLGWEVRRSTPEFALLGAGSRLGMPAELLFKPEPHSLLFATFLQHQNPIARAIWAPVGPAHRRVVPYLLHRAASA